jgi:hypothetical protein
MTSKQNLKLNVRGDLIEIPSYAISHIPFIKVLAETKSEDIIEIDVISPKFLNYIIEYIKNQQSPSFLKTILSKEFEKQTIEENLKYLAMDTLFNSFYDPKHTINGLPVIVSFTSDKCIMRDGQLIRACDIDLINTLIVLSIRLMNVYLIDHESQIQFTFYDDREKKEITKAIHTSWLICENKSWYIHVINYCKYNLPGSNIFKNQLNINM